MSHPYQGCVLPIELFGRFGLFNNWNLLTFKVRSHQSFIRHRTILYVINHFKICVSSFHNLHILAFL